MSKRWKQPKDLWEDIKRAKEYRKKYGQQKKWSTWLDWYRNIYPVNQVPSNYIYTLVRALVPRLVPRKMRHIATPTQPTAMGKAHALSMIDNQWIRESHLRRELRWAVMSAAVFGVGFLKVGWDHDAATQWMLADNKPGNAWVDFVEPLDLVVPWGTTDLRKAEWCAHRLLMRLEDVQKSELYDGTATLSADHVSTQSDDVPSRFHRGEDAMNDLVEVWEVHDAKEGLVMAINEHHAKFLRHENDATQVDGLPFVDIRFNDSGLNYWPPSDVMQIRFQQMEINEINAQLVAHRRNVLRKLIVESGMMDPSEIDKLNSPKVDEVVFVKGPPNQVAQELKFGIPRELYEMKQMLREDMREALGFSRNQMGEYDNSSRRTATEAAAVHQGAENRIEERRDLVMEAVVEVLNKVNLLIFDNWTEEQVGLVAGADGAQHWVSFTGESLKDSYDYSMEVYDEGTNTREKRRADTFQMMEVLGKAAQMGVKMNPQAILGEFINQFEGFDANQILGIQQVGNPESPMPMDQFSQSQQQATQTAVPQGAGGGA